MQPPHDQTLMTWNFRVVRHTEPKSRSVWYGVHEVFYNNAGKPSTMTQEPVQVDGESVKDIVAYLNMIKRDLKRLPVLDVDKIRWAKPPRGIRGSRVRKFKTVKDLMDDLRAR